MPILSQFRRVIPRFDAQTVTNGFPYDYQRFNYIIIIVRRFPSSNLRAVRGKRGKNRFFFSFLILNIAGQ